MSGPELGRQVKVYDVRTVPTVTVGRSDLAIIGERCEKKRIPAVRSAYLALLEAANDPSGWKHGALAARAGMSTGLFRECVGTLIALGVIRQAEGGALQLGTSAPMELPVLPPSAGSVPCEAQRSCGAEPRATKFYEVHAKRVTAIRGNKPPKTPQAIEAACRILSYEADSRKILDRLDWALQHRFWADKVLTLSDFSRCWGKLNAQYLAEVGSSNGTPAAPAPTSGRVSYSGERVEISHA